MATLQFKIGDTVQLGSSGEKGKIIDIFKPTGTYNMYKVHLMTTGAVRTAARHELIKGLADEDFQDLFNAYDINFLSGFNNYIETSPDLNQFSFARTKPDKSRPQKLCLPGTSEEQDMSTEPTYLSIPMPEEHLEETVTSAVLNSNNSDHNSNRFATINMTAQQFIEENENENTKRKTLGHQKLFETFLQEKKEHRKIHELSPSDLNTYLSEFLLRVRQKDGKEYEPVSLRSIVSSLDRYLKRHSYPTSIVKGIEFRQSMDVLSNKGKELKKTGIGQ